MLSRRQRVSGGKPKMIKAAWGAGLLLCAATASAKDQPIALSEADAATLQGKTVALTVHERPSFIAFTAGKATLGLLGTAAMVSAGNKIVDENGVEDPAILVRTQLAQALADRYGAIVLEPDPVASKAKKPKELAALHPEADFVFDVRSAGWQFIYFPSNWDNYWMGYNVQTQLIDTKTGRPLASMACGAHTKEHAHPPSRDQLLEQEARLLKDVTQHLGWTCVHVLAKEQYGLLPEQVAAIPAQYLDPLSPAPAADAAAQAVEAVAAAPVQAADPAAPVAASATEAATPEAHGQGSAEAPATPADPRGVPAAGEGAASPEATGQATDAL